MVPDGWQKVTLGEVVEISKGRSGHRVDETDQGIAYLGANAIDGMGENDGFVRANGRLLLAEPDDIVLLWDGERSGLSSWRLAGAVSSTAARLRPDQQHVVPGFLAAAMRNAYGWIQANRTGQAVPHAPKDLQDRLVLRLPPLPEQRKIATILSSVDDAIATTRKVIEQTKRVKEGLLQTLMTRGIGHTRFKKTEIGEIPEEWDVQRLDAIASVERGRFSARPRNDPKYYGGETPFVQTGDVTDSNVVLSTHTQTLNDAGVEVSRVFPTGTILITIAANIGEVAQAAYPVAFPDSVVGIQSGDRVDGRWLLYMLETRKPYLNQVATQNAQKNINLKILRPLKVPVPDLVEQRLTASWLDALSESVCSSKRLQESLKTLKRGLMQDLLTGRVRVQPD